MQRKTGGLRCQGVSDNACMIAHQIRAYCEHGLLGRGAWQGLGNVLGNLSRFEERAEAFNQAIDVLDAIQCVFLRSMKTPSHSYRSVSQRHTKWHMARTPPGRTEVLVYV